MNRWLKKLGNAPDSELTRLTKGGYVSSVSALTSPSEEKNASGNRWLAKLSKAPQALAEVPPATVPTVAADSLLASMTTPEPKEPKGAPAPLEEVERIIEVLAQAVGRDLGASLENLMRRAMVPLDRNTRASLTAEIDNAFESTQDIKQARERAAQAIRGKVGDPPPATLYEWLTWIEARCPINADDRRYLVDRLKGLTSAKLATACRWYAQTWAKAAAAEPVGYLQENAGRRAANVSLSLPGH